MPTTYIYLKNSDYAKLVHMATKDGKKVSTILREVVEGWLAMKEAEA